MKSLGNRPLLDDRCSPNAPEQIISLVVATLSALVVAAAIWWWPLGYLNVVAKFGLTLLVPLIFVTQLFAAISILLGKENVDYGWGVVIVTFVLFVSVVELVPWYWPPPPSMETKLATMVTVWQEKVETIAKARGQLMSDKAALLLRMGEMGFQSSKDVQKSKAHRYLAEELLEVQTQIKKLDGLEAKHVSAIEEVQSGLRRMGRQKLLATAGITDEEHNQLAETAAELDHQLESASDKSSAVPIELDLLLKETFGELHHEQASQNP